MFRSLPIERVKGLLSSNASLDENTVLENRTRYGTNDILEKSPYRLLELLKDTLLDPMIWFLIVASIMFAILHKYIESIILLLAILPIGGMDAFLHWRTQVSTRALSSRLITFARVVRSGKEVRIAAKEIVPGDLVKIGAGQYFPADGIVVAAHNAQVDESSLTGEAFPVAKKPLTDLASDQTTSMIDYQYWGFVGTRLLTGEVSLRVIYTGKETLYGEIIDSVRVIQQEKTPLQRAIARLVLALICIALLLCAVLAVVRYAQGFGLLDALLSAATLAVVALPDEFPMVFTFFLGVGVYRLAKKHALVQRAVTVENIGRVTNICTDKTGTITEGRFRIAQLLPVSGKSQTDLLLKAAIASRKESGDPLDTAILMAPLSTQETYPILKVYPFTEERKRETSVCETQQGLLMVTKGAPETLFHLSHLTEKEKKYWRTSVIKLAKQGYKVIACAEILIKDTGNLTEAEEGYSFIGLIAFIDPPRKEVYAAIETCQESGIRVIMITGDHPETAKKIAMDIGLGEGAPNVLTAEAAQKLLREQGGQFLHHVDAIARAIPSQKCEIVQALQKTGDIVAVTGDGVNDVPALRAADISIAMGERGTQSAKEAASIVLLDDNFGSIVNAISEGKQLFRNMQLSFKYLLMVHTPYVISAIVIPLLGYPLLYYPIHIVWIELFIHPTSMLVFQYLPETNKYSPPTAGKHIQFFSFMDWLGIILLGFYTSALVIIVYLVSLNYTGEAQVARANAFTAVGLTHIGLTIGLSRLKSLTARIIVLVSVLMLFMLVQIPVIAHFFQMQPPSLLTWLILSAFTGLTVWFAHRASA